MSLDITPNRRYNPYLPQRFVHASRWTIHDIARHFHVCGLRTRDANTHFREFANAWLNGLSHQPVEPAWDQVPVPIANDFTEPASSRKNKNRKLKKATIALNIHSHWPEAGQSTHQNPVVYDDSPPPYTEDPQPQQEAYDSTAVEVDEEDTPMSLDQDASRM